MASEPDAQYVIHIQPVTKEEKHKAIKIVKRYALDAHENERFLNMLGLDVESDPSA